ncbi:Metal binding domain of Ada [Anaerovibrio lipolyticus DSM 3074]|uniref:Nuclease n=2 Tax=Anaerovibrio lipolyticus TaxID=82374 RepID=A0A0B2K100_9FIRM|nr:Ada metal-binding domain-containing protein [Anaerovibrio lipolyticus]KHM51837.1 nuclease [Anaerovibrio lipolyticus]MBE6106325.1 nuclease [Anaerovibrio lipolyticus]SHI93803.1 Metal binding domain of Ada [Anaerovibrio lipolyticus DSM 3074]
MKKLSIATLIAVLIAMAAPAMAANYLANPRSMIFHYASCRTIKKTSNFIPIGSRQEAVDAGYRPCKVCNP